MYERCNSKTKSVGLLVNSLFPFIKPQCKIYVNNNYKLGSFICWDKNNLISQFSQLMLDTTREIGLLLLILGVKNLTEMIFVSFFSCYPFLAVRRSELLVMFRPSFQYAKTALMSLFTSFRLWLNIFVQSAKYQKCDHSRILLL